MHSYNVTCPYDTFCSYLMRHRFSINIKSWNITKQSGLLKNVKSSAAPQVTCTHIDLSDHHYQRLRPDHDVEDSEHLRMRAPHDTEDDEN